MEALSLPPKQLIVRYYWKQNTLLHIIVSLTGYGILIFFFISHFMTQGKPKRRLGFIIK